MSACSLVPPLVRFRRQQLIEVGNHSRSPLKTIDSDSFSYGIINPALDPCGFASERMRQTDENHLGLSIRVAGHLACNTVGRKLRLHTQRRRAKVGGYIFELQSLTRFEPCTRNARQ